MPRGYMQLGKNGVTENFIESLKNSFKNHDNIRISVLKSARHEKKKMNDYSEEILEKLGKNFTSRVIGFTIILKKWIKPVRL